MITNGIKNIKHRVTHLSTIRRNNRCLKLAKNIINDKYDRIYHYHVRKTGGKSILFMFMANECQDYYNKYEDLYTNIDHRVIINNKVFVKWHPILLQQGNYFFGSSHIPFDDIKLSKGTFTFTILRDPVDRVIAHYEMLLRRKNQQNQRNAIKIEFEWIDESFEYFLNSIPKHKLLNQLYMFSKGYSVSEAVDRILNLSHIILLENFEDGINKLYKKLGMTLKSIHTDNPNNKIEIPKIIFNRLHDGLELEYQLIEQINKHL